MEKVRINYNTARLLKKCGFNEIINGFYCEYQITQIDPEYPEGGGPFGMTKGEIELIDMSDYNSNLKDNETYHVCSAPTQDELFNWLRLNHNMHVIPYPILHLKNNVEIETEEKDFEYTYYFYVKGISQYVTVDETFDTYEKAFESGLFNALSLLKKLLK